MNRLISYAGMILLVLLGSKSWGQAGSIELKDGSGTVISSHASIKDAFAAVPDTISQAYVIEIKSSYTGSSETYPITFDYRFGTSPSNTITLRPASGVTSVSIATNTASVDVISIDSLDYFIIDGRAGGTGTSKALTIAQNNTGANNTIQLINGATHNIIRYCNINNASTTSAGIGVFIGDSPDAGGNSDNTIEHCKVTGGRYGINSDAGTNLNMRNLIYGNEILNNYFAGIWYESGTGSITIDSNSIYHSGIQSTTAPFGILLDGTTDTVTITRNKIYNIAVSGTSTMYGIQIRTVTGTNLTRIYNNFISLTNSATSTGVYGIGIAGSVATNAEIYFNTVKIGGTLGSGGTSGNVVSAGFHNTASSTSNNVDLRNNIFINQRAGGTSGVQHVALSATNTNGTFNLDYNTYNASSGNLVRWGSSVYTSLAAWQAAAPSGTEQNSNDAAVTTVSAIDLHVAGSSLGDFDLKATPITFILNDIDNNPRGGSTYRGADDDPSNPIVGKKNEIGVLAVDEPLAGTCATTSAVKVTVKNYGINQVDTFTVNWSVNGTLQTPVTFYTVLDTVLGGGSTTAQVTLGNINTTNGVNYDIVAWTSGPNNLTDPDKKNDTAKKTFRMALAAGTYTIGGTSPDFATVIDAADALNNFGICGPVVFEIRPGTYSGKIYLGQVAGTSVTNTITFKSSTNDSTSVIITSASSASTADNYTFMLDGTDNIIIRNITLERSGAAANATILSFNGVTEDVVVAGNIFKGVTSTATDANGVRSAIFSSTSATTRNIEIYNNLMDNNSNGVWFNNTNTNKANYSSGVKIYNNTIKPGYTGIFVAGQFYPQIYDNSIIRYDQTINVDFYGISLNLVDSSLLVTRNYVETNRGDALRFRDCYGYAGNEGRVTNNMVVQSYSGTSANYGLVIETRGSKLLFAHNTILMNNDYTSTTANNGARALYAPTGTANAFSDIRILNNIFYSAIDGVAAYMVTGFLPGITEMDYNLYYSGDQNLAYVSAYQPDLAAYQSVTGHEAHGYNQQVTFAGAKNAHIVFMQRFAFGKTGLSINDDFDGDARCLSLPTVGADEYNPGLGNPDATFIGPNSVSTGDRGYFLFNGNLNQIALYSWMVNGVAAGQNVNLIYTFPTAGTYTVQQIAENCSGTDTFTVTYTVADPTAVPDVNFSAERNQIYVNEAVRFTDLSQNGPTKWSWSVTPNNGSIIFSDSTEQDPLILFTEPGKYEVCLIAENNIGAGTQRCRPSYIEVYPVITMCSETVSNFERGKIFDDGGAGNFGNNINCAFFINPCASEVNLKFNQWVNTDADDKLTIYDGDTTDPNNIIAVIPGGTVNPGGTTGFTAKSGRMWLVWKTDNATNYAGFEAEWSSVPASVNPTAASFDAPDTVFVNSPVVFKNTSSGSGLLFFWDFDFPNFEPDNNNSLSSVNPVKTFNFTGTYDVLLESTNCLGKDSIIKSIVVINPSTAPVPDFTASLTRFSTGETIQLLDNSGQGPTSWNWEITPSNGVIFLDAANNQNPRVRFSFGGFYTVKLTVSNSIGTDSVVKTSYLQVLEYCRPNVSTLNTDVTIRRIVFEDIDHSSDYGVNKYNDFTGIGEIASLSEGGTYNISIERNTNNERVNFAVWIDYNQDGDFDNVTERALFDSATTVQVLNGTITIPAGVTLGETRMRVAISRANLTTLPCGPVVVGEYEDYKVNIHIDDIAPVITLLGPNPDFIEVGYGFTDSGAVAVDNVDGPISTITVTGSVDTLAVGTYVITYKATDARGNTDSVKRTVHITPDVTAPVLTLNGNTTETIEVFAAYNEQGGTAVDNPFGTNLTDSIKITGAVDTAKIGSYVITYTVSDANGNTSTLTRTVIVRDTTKPVVTLIGGATVTHDVNTPYLDSGATVTDNYNNGLTYIVTGTVNTQVLGTYELTFTAVDSSGNMSVPVKRTVNVVDRIAPVITLVGNDIVYLARWQNYVDSGYTVSDNYSDSVEITVTTEGTWVNASVEGLYYLQYRAVDSVGNVAYSAKRIIYVQGLNSINPVTQYNTTVYPNPSNGNFTIKSSKDFDGTEVITITNLLGAQVYEYKPSAGSNTVNVAIEGISAGVYMVNIRSNNSVETTKIIVE